MKCIICQTPLTGGLDTYGLAGLERCFNHQHTQISAEALYEYRYLGRWPKAELGSFQVPDGTTVVYVVDWNWENPTEEWQRESRCAQAPAQATEHGPQLALLLECEP